MFNFQTFVISMPDLIFTTFLLIIIILLEYRRDLVRLGKRMSFESRRSQVEFSTVVEVSSPTISALYLWMLHGIANIVGILVGCYE